MGIDVRNKNGHIDCTCDCKSYICHWENYSGKKATKCYNKACSNTTNLVGAHVHECTGDDTLKQWIIPLCKDCNSIDSKVCFELDDDYTLIWVGPRDKCKPC